MACICQVRLNLENGVEHSFQCDEHNRREIKAKEEWDNQDHQCSGSGYAHKAHGKCTGWAYDRT